MVKFVQAICNMEGLTYAWKEDGEQFVMSSGIMQMPVSCVGSWDIHQMVCSIYNLFHYYGRI
jgi:hypothetical protein